MIIMGGVRAVHIEMLFLDVDGCGRCDGTQRNLATSIDLLRPVLAAVGVTVTVATVPVTSAAQAQQVQLVSSPTIRVGGVPIGGELTESACADCSPAGVAVSCRTWWYGGTIHEDAPAGLIIDAVLGHVYGRQAPLVQPGYAGLPGNLRQFFNGGDAGS